MPERGGSRQPGIGVKIRPVLSAKIQSLQRGPRGGCSGTSGRHSGGTWLAATKSSPRNLFSPGTGLNADLSHRGNVPGSLLLFRPCQARFESGARRFPQRFPSNGRVALHPRDRPVSRNAHGISHRAPTPASPHSWIAIGPANKDLHVIPISNVSHRRLIRPKRRPNP
jgi:hypothetical protein